MSKCPNCGQDAVFTEHSHSWVETHGLDCGPYEHCYQEWLVCGECGSRTDDEELAAVNQEEDSDNEPTN